MPNAHERVNLFFRLAALAGGLFVITIFAMVASVYSDSPSPVRGFLTERSGQIIVWEVAAILVLGLLAMAVDRLRIIRRSREREQTPPLVSHDPRRPAELSDSEPA